MIRLLGYKLLAFLPLLMISEAWAQTGESTLPMLSLPATTKAMALGGVTTTIVAHDAALGLESPALFGKEQHGQLSLSYMNYWGDSHLGTAFYTRQIGERTSWGVGARYVSYGTIEGRDLLGQSIGELGAKDIALQGSLSYELSPYLRAGASIKGIYSNLAGYQAFGLGVDVGINYFSQSRERSIGISLVNVGTLLRPYSDGRTEALPWDVRIGLSQRLSHAPFQVHLTAYGLRPRGASEYIPPGLSAGAKLLRHLAVGFEYIPSDKFWIGMGYNPRIGQNYKALRGAKLSGFSLGAGFNRAGYRAAIAVTAYDSSFWAVMATFSTDFGLISRL